MPLTNSDRRRRHIQKLKENGLFDKYKEKKAEQERNRRKRLKDGLKHIPKAKREKLLKMSREKSRQRVHRCRQRKKDKDHNQESAAIKSSDESSYTSEAELMRDVAKVEKSLPKSPTLRIAVLKELYKEVFGNGNLDSTDNNSYRNDKVKTERGISAALTAEVKNFYERDDISQICPKIKESTTLIPYIETKKPIRRLVHKLSDVYALFVEQHNIKMGNNSNSKPPLTLAKFCALRPTHVKPMHVKVNIKPHHA